MCPKEVYLYILFVKLPTSIHRASPASLLIILPTGAQTPPPSVPQCSIATLPRCVYPYDVSDIDLRLASPLAIISYCICYLWTTCYDVVLSYVYLLVLSTGNIIFSGFKPWDKYLCYFGHLRKILIDWYSILIVTEPGTCAICRTIPVLCNAILKLMTHSDYVYYRDKANLLIYVCFPFNTRYQPS